MRSAHLQYGWWPSGTHAVRRREPRCGKRFQGTPGLVTEGTPKIGCCPKNLVLSWFVLPLLAQVACGEGVGAARRKVPIGCACARVPARWRRRRMTCVCTGTQALTNLGLTASAITGLLAHVNIIQYAFSHATQGGTICWTQHLCARCGVSVRAAWTRNESSSFAEEMFAPRFVLGVASFVFFDCPQNMRLY